MTRSLALLLLLLAGLGGSAPAAARPADPAPQSATSYHLIDPAKTDHAVLEWAPWTRTVLLFAGDYAAPDALTLLTATGERVDLNPFLGQVQIAAPAGVNVAGGYSIAGTPGITATVVLPPDGYLLIQGGLVVGYQPPSRP